ncbi:MAG: sulfotransferase [Rhodobacteraceae bacterium]|nr:sulfotransferase [Paracoccaceae bacterium]
MSNETIDTPQRLARFGLPNLKGSLFIITYGRSGSTLLQSLLHTIPGAHLTGENYNVLAFVFRASHRAHLTKREWGQKPKPGNHPWYGADAVMPQRFERGMINLFVRDLIQPPTNARWIGFKEIRYPAVGDDLPRFLTFLRRSFPNAHVVFNSRDPRKVAKSRWWANKPRKDVIKMVTECDARFATYAAANPDHAIHVHHENTVSDPESLRPVFEMLDEPFDLDRINEVLAQPLTH